MQEATRAGSPLSDARAAVEQAAPEDLPNLIGELEAVKAVALFRLCNSVRPVESVPAKTPERLLTPAEALAIVGGARSLKWLYRQTATLPFRRDVSAKTIRFEENGLRRWLERSRTR